MLPKKTFRHQIANGSPLEEWTKHSLLLIIIKYLFIIGFINLRKTGPIRTLLPCAITVSKICNSYGPGPESVNDTGPLTKHFDWLTRRAEMCYKFQ